MMFAIYDSSGNEVFDRRPMNESTRREMQCFLKTRGIWHIVDPNNPPVDLGAFSICRVVVVYGNAKNPLSLLDYEAISIVSGVSTVTQYWVDTEDLEEAITLAKAYVHEYRGIREAEYINFGYGFVSACTSRHLASILGIYTSAVHGLKTTFDLKAGNTFITLTAAQTLEVSEAAMLRQQNLFTSEAQAYSALDACTTIQDVREAIATVPGIFNTLLD